MMDDTILDKYQNMYMILYILYYIILVMKCGLLVLWVIVGLISTGKTPSRTRHRLKHRNPKDKNDLPYISILTEDNKVCELEKLKQENADGCMLKFVPYTYK